MLWQNFVYHAFKKLQVCDVCEPYLWFTSVKRIECVCPESWSWSVCALWGVLSFSGSRGQRSGVAFTGGVQLHRPERFMSRTQIKLWLKYLGRNKLQDATDWWHISFRRISNGNDWNIWKQVFSSKTKISAENVN